MKRAFNQHYLLLHFIVFIWGFSPILGRYITADAWQLVWYRILIALPVVYLYLKLTRQSLVVEKKYLWQMALIGTIIMVHWVAFYAAIKVSNISVTMVAFSTGALFSALLEPLFYKRRVRLYEIVIGLVIIGAISLIFSIQTEYALGMVLGITAAFLSALFGVLNGLLSPKVPSGIISFYELSAAFIGLSAFLLVSGKLNMEFVTLDQPSVIGVILLSLVCTVFPFIKTVDLARHISPYTIVLTVNLETVYGIIWAILLYNENKEVKPEFYQGVLIILAAVFLNSYLKRYSERKKEINTT